MSFQNPFHGPAAMPPGTRSPERRCRRAQRSRGVSLLFSLVALAALSLAAVALIRAVNTGGGILGNLGFKQDSLLASDEATRQAVVWLNQRLGGTTLHTSDAAAGYHASNPSALDPTASTSNPARTLIDWNGNSCASLSFGTCLRASGELTLANQVKARYVIFRLCSAEGNPATAGIQCATPLAATVVSSTERNSPRSTNPRRAGTALQSQYFRILVRAEGVRKTFSYTDTVVHF